MEQSQGPCLPHCYKCSPVTMIFAHISMVYIIASIVYILSTRCIGTPFKDSLTEEQKLIKQHSASKRSMIFTIGLLVGFVSIGFIKPFKYVKR